MSAFIDKAFFKDYPDGSHLKLKFKDNFCVGYEIECADSSTNNEAEKDLKEFIDKPFNKVLLRNKGFKKEE